MGATSSSSAFCIGGAMAMGGNGLSLTGAGSSGDSDCIMLWTEVFTVNSLERAVLANVSVFLLALLAQFLTTTNANRMQRAKQYGKTRRLAALTADTEHGGANRYDSASDWRRDATAAINGLNGAALEQTVALPLVSRWEHFGDSVQHGFRILVAYLLMLAAMTYDVGLISSTVVGFMVGFYFFTNDSTKVPASADPCCS
jgi:hypothetical protein